jgi:hypothetical protein
MARYYRGLIHDTGMVKEALRAGERFIKKLEQGRK